MRTTFNMPKTTRFSAVDETLFFQWIELTWPSAATGHDQWYHTYASSSSCYSPVIKLDWNPITKLDWSPILKLDGHVHNWTPVQLHNWTSIQLYNWTSIQLHNWTSIQLRNWWITRRQWQISKSYYRYLWRHVSYKGQVNSISRKKSVSSTAEKREVWWSHHDMMISTITIA